MNHARYITSCHWPSRLGMFFCLVYACCTSTPKLHFYSLHSQNIDSGKKKKGKKNYNMDMSRYTNTSNHRQWIEAYT